MKRSQAICSSEFTDVKTSVGGWVPITKALVSELPTERPYTRLEAMFSLTLDYDQDKEVTVKGFASLWGWSRGKVGRFLKEIGADIVYPEDTENRQNQRGQIMIQITSRKRADSGQIKMIDSKWLHCATSIKRTDDEQKADRSQGTTIKPNPNPINTSLFSFFWEAYPRKVSKGAAEKAWQKIKPDETLLGEMLMALQWQREQDNWHKDNGKYIPHPATWLNCQRWTDEAPASLSQNKTTEIPEYMFDPAFDDQEATHATQTS